ncbi:helix-turn-helix transcriptional regulator [Ruegeria sp. EL01]|uniref:helix-turn-helix domain-containing protein n=1 Tax=Ruegeria sp. EL01 TaxID=2107578 RepID=UPI000EA82229|nr:helix-turn-helix transcriptional regulator [Ruegeria sp. EL01]
MSTAKTTYSMILCSLMSQICEQQGLLQKDFFQKTGIATGSWSRIMRGQAHFQIEDIRAACHVLGLSVGDLTKMADKRQEQLVEQEGIEVVSKDDLKSEGSAAGKLIAGAALAFLLTRLSQ